MAFLELLKEAAEVDMGILYEPRDSLGLAYRTRSSLYAQDAAITLDYAAKTVFEIEPVEDDDEVRNDLTVSRINGSSYRAELTSGPLSVNPPPNGIGRYDDEISVSLAGDSDLPDQAGWRLHLGTVDEARYPVVGVRLEVPAFRSNPSLTADATSMDIGDLVVVTNAPAASTSPEDIQQIGRGFSESISTFEWAIDVNCTPATPWNVAVWDETTGTGEARYSSDGTTITEDLTLVEVGINVTTPNGPIWSATAVPYDIEIGGERMTVTAVSGTTASQVFTVVRSVNGVSKIHNPGAEVRLAKPGFYAL
jgi:hypothetical protein